MADLGFAVKEKVTPDHDVIDEAIREEAEVWTRTSDMVGFADSFRATLSSPSLWASSTGQTVPK